MLVSYNQISKEIGYVGYTSYPTMSEMEILLRRLSSNPTILDFKKALGFYRFIPEAKTEDEQRMIYMLQSGLSMARKTLFTPDVKRSYLEVAFNFFMNLIPSTTIFHLLI